MSIYDNIEAGKYKNSLPWPSRNQIYKLMNKPSKDLTAEELNRIVTYKKDQETIEQEYRDARLLYNSEEARLDRLFFDDLAAEFGVTGHPKLAKLERLAWDHGHASGLNEVASYYSDYVELIK